MEDLGYGRCELIMGVPDSWLDVDSMGDLADLSIDLRERGRDLRIATKYPRLVERHLLRHGVNYFSLVQSSGTLEASPAMGFAGRHRRHNLHRHNHERKPAQAG